MNKNNSVTITLPDNGMCAIVRKINGRYEIDTGRIEGKDIFLGPQPDPITGLVPCGCGGKAKIWPSGSTQFTKVITDYEVGCAECAMTTGWVLGKQENAMKVWNTAMGWKGGAE